MQQLVNAPTTVHDLVALGFSSREIASLRRLKARYHPFRESCERDREFEQIAFLKWRYEQGRIEQG